MAKEGISEADAQKMLYTGGFTIEATVNTKLQSQMENLMLNTNDAYFPAGWHEEEVTSISDDDVQVMNEDGTPRPALPRTAPCIITATCAPGGHGHAGLRRQRAGHRGRSGRKDQEPLAEPCLQRGAADRLHHRPSAPMHWAWSTGW